MYVYVCTVCMYVCMYVCMHVCIMPTCATVYMFYVCMYASVYVCMYVCIYVCVYMIVCMYVFDLGELDDALQESGVCEDARLDYLVAVFQEHESLLVFAHTKGYLYVCMIVCMYVCMYVCMCRDFVCMYGM